MEDVVLRAGWLRFYIVLQPLLSRCKLTEKCLSVPQCIIWQRYFTVWPLGKLASKSGALPGGLVLNTWFSTKNQFIIAGLLLLLLLLLLFARLARACVSWPIRGRRKALHCQELEKRISDMMMRLLGIKACKPILLVVQNKTGNLKMSIMSLLSYKMYEELERYLNKQ